MSVDLTQFFKDSRNKLTMWKLRYSSDEYPYKVVLNIFYTKFAVATMWDNVINNNYPDWLTAYRDIKGTFEDVSRNQIVPHLENWLQEDRKVSTIKFSDFTKYISSASKGDLDALKGIEYTYFLNRMMDEYLIFWLAMVTSGMDKQQAFEHVTGAVIPDLPLNTQAELEQVVDSITEVYLRVLMVEELNGKF